MSDIIQRYHTIIDSIKKTEHQYNREPNSVNLIAVSKTKPAQMVRELVNLGQQHFGENYLQEALEKQKILSDLNLTWHFIGHIQSNKTKDITENFDWVHGVDRIKIAKRLNDQRPEGLAALNICVQVNLEGEQTKSGVSPEQITSLATEISTLPKITLRGLMAIPSPKNDFNKQRHLFATMKSLLEELKDNNLNVDTLSMGMTNDMQAAIAEGATHIRIGTALFGARNYN